MGLPTGDTITLSSGVIELSRNRSMSLSIVLKDNTGGTDFNNTYSIKPSSIGKIDFPVDVEEDSSEVSDFYFYATSFEFSFWSNITSSVDFGIILDQLAFNDLIKVELTYQGNKDTYLCTKSDVKYNRLDREVTIKSYPPFKYSEEVSTFDISEYEIEVAYDDNGLIDPPDVYNFVTLNDLINEYISTFGAPTTRIQSYYTEIAKDYQSGASNKNLTGYVTNTNNRPAIEGNAGKYYIDSFLKAKSRVLEAGIAEAAIVGVLFGEAFYVRRDYNSTADSNYYTEIEASELEEFDLDFAASYVKDISVQVGGVTSSDNIDPTRYQSIDVTIPQYAKQVIIDSGTAIGTEIKSGFSGEVSFGTIASDALSIYKKVTQASDTIKFSGTILGVDKIKPYQFIRLDTAISPYITSSNRDIRLSSVTYDIFSDKVEFEGYSI